MSKRNSRKSTLENIIVELVKSSPEKKITIKTLEYALAFDTAREKKRLRRCLNRLLSGKVLTRTGNTVYYNEPHKKEKKADPLIEGRIEFNQRGTGFVVNESFDEDIRISKNDTGLALPDDVVLVRLSGSRRDGQQRGKVVDIKERGKKFYVGTLKKTEVGTYFIEPDQKSAQIDFFLHPENLNGAVHGEKVTFKLKNWVHPTALPEAEVLSRLGKQGTNEANILSILAENELSAEFSKEAEAYAAGIVREIPPAEIKRRKDLRGETIFTIDPEDAKDFDDALSIKMLPGGNFLLGVHIADVTHYVEPESPLDTEAYDRSFTIYLVDRVIPMLPEKLSNDVCSLRPGEDKLTFSCFMEVDKQGRLVNYSLAETIIRSRQKLSYEEAQAVLDGKNHELKSELKALESVAKKLLDKRFREGAIDFESPEPRFVLDKNGKPLDVVIQKRLFAHRLIEECMLLANKTVAEHVLGLREKSGKKITKDLFPFFYRIHDKPDVEKLRLIADQVKPLGIKFDTSSSVSPKQINDLLKKVKDTTVETIVNELMLRAMAKAEYSPANIGHFGLGFKQYAHFTSPIRRYPDILVHRLLKSYAAGKPSYSYKALAESGEYCSERERVTVDAERDSVKLKQVEFMSTKIGETFEGVISGVTERGIFVNLKDIYCEGMIRIGELKDDYYIYNQQMHGLVGRSKKKMYRLGDTVKVKVESTNFPKRQIDFVPA